MRFARDEEEKHKTLHKYGGKQLKEGEEVPFLGRSFGAQRWHPRRPEDRPCRMSYCGAAILILKGTLASPDEV